MGLFDFFAKSQDGIQTRRHDFEKLDKKLKEEEALRNSEFSVDIRLSEAKTGDIVTIGDVKYELGDIIHYTNHATQQSFVKYELISDKTSIWLKVDKNAIYQFIYLKNFTGETESPLTYNNESYELIEEGILYKESIRKYDNDEASLDKTCEYSMYKNVHGELILIEEVDEFKDTSLGRPILESDIRAQRYVK